MQDLINAAFIKAAAAVKEAKAQYNGHDRGACDWQNIDVNRAGALAFAQCFPGEAIAASRLD